MLDPENDAAEQLARAIRDHQKNLIEKDRAEQNVTVSHQLETLTDPSGKDD